jgi:hypothetical protein
MRCEAGEGEEVTRTPIRAIFLGCCASEEIQSAKNKAQKVRNRDLAADLLIENPKPKIQNRFTESLCPPAPAHAAEL